MKQEDKELLLKDLCGRLPYGVKIRIEYPFLREEEWHSEILYGLDLQRLCIANTSIRLEEFKPYLFPLSSMTEEQEEKFKNLYYRYHESAFIFNERFSYDRYSIKDIGFYPYYLQDLLNKNHFDYRGLIPKDLAIDATGLNVY